MILQLNRNKLNNNSFSKLLETSRIFILALEITFLLNNYFFLQIAYELSSQSLKLNKHVGVAEWKFFWKK